MKLYKFLSSQSFKKKLKKRSVETIKIENNQTGIIEYYEDNIIIE